MSGSRQGPTHFKLLDIHSATLRPGTVICRLKPVRLRATLFRDLSILPATPQLLAAVISASHKVNVLTVQCAELFSSLPLIKLTCSRMAETSFIDAAIKKHENVIKYLEKRRGNTLNIDFVNNIMVTYDYNNGDWEDAMGYFTKYEAYMNEKFAFIPAFKLGEALRNLPLSAKRILAVKAIMRSVLQLHQSKGMHVRNLVRPSCFVDLC